MKHWMRTQRIGRRLDLYTATLLDLRWLEEGMAVRRELLIAV